MRSLAPSLQKMRAQDWENWEEVEDHSSFVVMLEKVFTAKVILLLFYYYFIIILYFY